jgi:hypothetical protein
VRTGPAAPAILLALVVALGIALAGCGPVASPAPTLGPIATASIEEPAIASPVVPESPVTGVLLGVTAEGLTQVKGFTLRTSDGLELSFEIGTLENGVEFPPGHLAEHLASSSPVRVFFRVEGSRLVVYRLEDASS